ncbi:UNKNOWN [Stylonychia lemnae]|uniref:C2 NT-type domain-containing protein n=1 Tax=Stylonychia lemnae TaxID=5949 RepID=A0A077ZV95_STYLE|nr:UNKNOWN [Stylonychia lemnae]|eukprot:CDW73810.1 UNKNOWN [Stylonychia lemnae]
MDGTVMNRKVAIDLNIRSAHYKVEEPTEVYIEWQRGGKHIDTKSRDIDPSQSSAMFNEKFQMKTVLEFDPSTNLFLKKHSVLALFRKKDKKLLGQTDFDLSIYANQNKPTGDKLVLKDCDQSDAFIEIFIKASAGEAETPSINSLKRPSTLFNIPTEELQKEEQERQKQKLLKQIKMAQGELQKEKEVASQHDKKIQEMSSTKQIPFQEYSDIKNKELKEMEAKIQNEQVRQEDAQKYLAAFSDIKLIFGNTIITEQEVQKQIDKLKKQIKMLEFDRDYKQLQVTSIYSMDNVY